MAVATSSDTSAERSSDLCAGSNVATLSGSLGPATASTRDITEQAPVRPAAGKDRGGPPGPPGRWRRGLARTAAHPLARHAALLLGFIAAGVVLTWPLATNLTDARLPGTRDIGAYVWGFWWMARQVRSRWGAERTERSQRVGVGIRSFSPAWTGTRRFGFIARIRS